MPSTYSAYYNIATASATTANKPATSMPTSQRSSISSAASAEPKKASRWHRFLDELKPLEEPMPVTGFFTPIQPYPARAKKTSANAENSKAAKAAKAYESFKVAVGGPRVFVR